MAVQMRPLTPELGIEAVGVDLLCAGSGTDWTSVVEAYWEKHLLLVRGPIIDLDDQVRFVSRFGTVRPPVAAFQPEGHTEVASYASNVMGRFPNSGHYMPHRDDTATSSPCLSMCLHALQVTSVGGETIFVDGQRAYQALSSATKAEVSSLQAIHLGPDPVVSAEYKDGEMLQRPIREFGGTPEINMHAVWPVVQHHPVTHRPVLYVDDSSFYSFDGWTVEESRDLLRELLAAFDDPELRYRHIWQVGDTILWDNMTLLHARTSFPDSEPRTLRKLLVTGPTIDPTLVG
jgi:alpha-ketoglutarate-dependent taurine dioxygenase